MLRKGCVTNCLFFLYFSLRSFDLISTLSYILIDTFVLEYFRNYCLFPNFNIIFLPIHLPFLLSFSLSIYLPCYLSLYPSTFPATFPSIFLSIHLPFLLSFFLSIYLSCYLSLYAPFLLSIHFLSIYPFSEYTSIYQVYSVCIYLISIYISISKFNKNETC